MTKIKPMRIEIPHPLYRDNGSEICLFVKEPQRKYKDMVSEANISSVKKVIDVLKLRKKHTTFEAKRILCMSYDIFIADRAVLPFLPRLLGKKFFRMKRQPIPINVSGSAEALKKEIERARDSTFMFINSGPCCAVKIGNTNFSKQEIVENIIRGMENIAKHIPGHWKNIQAIHIKTSNSVALPIYNSLPNLATKIKVRAPISSDQDKKQEAKENKKQVAKEDKRQEAKEDKKQETKENKKQETKENKTLDTGESSKKRKRNDTDSQLLSKKTKKPRIIVGGQRKILNKSKKS